MKIFPFLLLLIFASCHTAESQSAATTISEKFIEPTGKTIKTRFLPSVGFTRVDGARNSFAAYLQNLPLQAHGAKVHYYDGGEKYNDVYDAVVKMDVGKRDLQQCADAIMRLRAEYLYAQQDFAGIHFNFTNGDRIDYDKWRKGYRIKVSGNKVLWQKTAAPNDDYATFRKYMNIIFSYAGTLSLEKELKSKSLTNVEIGDVFIQGGSPGHAVIVVDLVENKETGERRFLLAQSYMPAQEIHVLKNIENENGSPWYSSFLKGSVQTPEWEFGEGDLKRF